MPPHMQAICDFDGTISVRDVTDLVLEHLAPPEWHAIEDRWERGEITSAECMRAQIRLIRATPEALDRLLDTVDIDPHFAAFKARCDRDGIAVRVLSDGVDYFIRRILDRHGITGLTIEANHLVSGADGFDLVFPFRTATCRTGAGVCKCNAIARADAHIYVGDGRSDFCVSHRAQHVFAKGALIAYCRDNAIPHTPFSSFAEIYAAIPRAVSPPAVRLAG